MLAGTQASDRDRDPDPYPDENGDPDWPIRIAIPKILCRVNGAPFFDFLDNFFDFVYM